MDNEECAEYYPVSHVGACRCRSDSGERMVRDRACLAHCRSTAERFEQWKENGRRGPRPSTIACHDLQEAEGRIVKVELGPTVPPHGVGAKTRLPAGLKNAEGPVHYICIGMFKRGVVLTYQAEKCLKNLDNHKALQDLQKYQLGLYGFGTHNASRKTEWSFRLFIKAVCQNMTKTAPIVYRWPCPQQRDFYSNMNSKEQLNCLFRNLYIERNIRAEYHNELTVHIHHHKLLNCQSPESPICSDILDSLHAFVQRMMAEHYDYHALDAEREAMLKGCKSKLEFPSSEVHALSLYNPNVTLNTQVAHSILLGLPQELKAGKLKIAGNAKLRLQPPPVNLKACI